MADDSGTPGMTTAVRAVALTLAILSTTVCGLRVSMEYNSYLFFIYETVVDQLTRDPRKCTAVRAEVHRQVVWTG